MFNTRYSRFKNSRVEWLREIPSHWQIMPLKHALKLVSDKVLTRGSNCRYLGMENVESQTGAIVDTSVEVEGLANKFQPQDILFGKLRPYLAKVALVDFWGLCSTEFLVFRSRFGDPRYFRYLIVSQSFISLVNSSTYGSKMPRANSDFICSQYLPVPDKNEQTSIANFIDQQSARIDKAIRVKEQQIVLLKERKQILIQNAVTRGLKPDAPMRDSGVEWIGEIPAHWDVMANRALFTERVEPGRDGLPLLSVSIHSGVSEEEVSDEENIRGRVKITDKTKYNLVRPGDIAFNMMRAWQGAIGEVRTEGMISPAYTIAMPSKKIVAKFFEYQYRAPIFIQQMDRNSKGITDFRKRLYWDEFKQLSTLVPPTEEQEAIVEYIDREVAKQDRAVSLLEQQITKLKEYKATLINSAVTGKIKVPGVVEPAQGMNEPEAREVCQ